MGRNLGKAMKYADSLNVRNALILGKKDLESGLITVRPMDTGDQVQIEIGEITDYFKK